MIEAIINTIYITVKEEMEKRSKKMPETESQEGQEGRTPGETQSENAVKESEMLKEA